MNPVDVVVVGGGAAGSLAARAGAEAKARVLLLERAPRREVCCAGLVSLGTAQRLGVPKGLVLREIRGVQIFGPEGLALELRADHPKALVLDRTGLDQWLRLAAQEKGVEVWPLAARAVEDRFVQCSGVSIPFEILIGADGARSTVARALGLPGPRELLVGAQAQVEVELGDQVQVFLGIGPDFFGWAVPAEEGRARVGLATGQGRTAQEVLRSWLSKHFPNSRVLRFQTGLIPIGPPVCTASGRALLVGNAAAQVKPLTGGGLAFLSQCAPLAGELASQGPAGLARYEAAWREKIGKELDFQLQARASFLRLGPGKTAELLRRVPKKLAEFLAQEGEIDEFSVLPRKLRRRPDLWPSLLGLLRWLPRELLG